MISTLYIDKLRKIVFFFRQNDDGIVRNSSMAEMTRHTAQCGEWDVVRAWGDYWTGQRADTPFATPTQGMIDNAIDHYRAKVIYGGTR